MIFTPPDLALTLARDWIGELPESTLILDPACGDGALLLAALEALGGGTAAAARLRGIELLPELAARTRARLAAAVGESPEDFEQQIATADALDPETRWPEGAAILANPPWLSFSGRHAGSGAPPARVSSGWPSLQGAFFERIARHCGESQSRARMLLPASLLELPRYEPARVAAFQHAHLAVPAVELGEDAFDDVIEPALIVELAPGPGSPRANEVQESALMTQLSRFSKLPPRTFADPGVHTGNSAKELVAEGSRVGWADLRRGADLAAYDLGQASLCLRLDLERTAPRRFRIGALEQYERFPILLRQTASRPIAALHTRPTYFRNSLLAVRAVPELAPEFVVALLNSSVAGAWMNARFRDARQRTFPQMKVGPLQTLPTPMSRRSENVELHDDVVNAVRALRPEREHFTADVGRIDARISAAFGLDASIHATLSR